MAQRIMKVKVLNSRLKLECKYVSRKCLKISMSLFLAAMSSSSSDNVTQFVRLSDSFFDFVFIVSYYK